MATLESLPAVRVLLVEDSLPVLERLRSEILESTSVKIVGEAATITEALAFFREHEPDAVVLDLNLGDASGCSVLEEMKRTRPDCCVIVLTNLDVPEYRDLCMELGADFFLNKYRDFERVPQVLKGLVARTDRGRSGSPRDVGMSSFDGNFQSRDVPQAGAPFQKAETSSNPPTPSGTALQDSEQRFVQLLRLLPVAVYTCDLEGRITFFNEAAAALWGRTPELGRESWCGSWKIYEPDGRAIPFHECPVAVTMREKRTVRDREVIIERPDGKRINVLTHPRLLHDATGAVSGAVNMLEDITDRKKAETELLRRSEELAATNADLQRFQRLAFGRELRIAELHNEISELCRELKRPAAPDVMCLSPANGSSPALQA